MKIINQDLLTVTKGIIAHQCNCKGVMGAGLAKAMRAKYPMVYHHYMLAHSYGKLKLGIIQVIRVGVDLHAANLMAQDRYGRDGLYTDYDALRTCLKDLNRIRQQLADHGDDYLEIHLPMNMGCSLAGGDWNIVSEIIKEEIPDAIICNYG